MSKQRLVVIGNGMAGARLVEDVLARGGGDMFEIVVFGEEPHGNYNRILLSSVLAGSQDSGDIFINPLPWYEQNGVRLHPGVRVGWIDRLAKKVYAPGDIIEPYDSLVIATGSAPFVPPLDGLYGDAGDFKPGVFVFRTLDDCADIINYASNARRAAVIGGGLLGLEAARGLLSRGLEVHVVHLLSHLMESQLDPTAGAILKDTLEQMGVGIHLEKVTTEVMGDGHVTGLAFRDGSTLDCDMLVISAGIRPNVDLARQSGLMVQRGILVHDDLACRNNPDIYAIGECAQHRGQTYGLVAPLWEQAEVLAERLTGSNPRASYKGSRVSTKLKVMGVDLAAMGEIEASQGGDEVVTYVEPSRGVYKKLIVREDRLAGAILLGDGLAIPGVLQVYDRGAAVPESRADLLFPASVESKAPDVADMPDMARVCHCNGVSKGSLVAAMKAGCDTLKAVCDATRAGTGCGSCKPDVRAILELSAKELSVKELSVRELVPGIPG